MNNAQNGARIKAWAGSGVGSGIVQNITFEYFTESGEVLPGAVLDLDALDSDIDSQTSTTLLSLIRCVKLGLFVTVYPSERSSSAT